jgi:RNA polymerase sigma-70 factor (sigma-E family)
VTRADRSAADHAESKAASFIEDRGDWLGRCAYLLTRDREAALDLVQDTLLQTWKARDLVDRADDRDRYVLRIMLNLHRAQFRRRRLDLTTLDHPWLPVGEDPSAQVVTRQVVSQALDTLSERQLAVVVLRYWADMDDMEIADVLACRRSTVRSLASRGLVRLRRYLEPTR